MKFLIDAMLGKLARILRMFGFDAIYANDLEEFFELSPVPDHKLIDYAKKNERILITKDLPLHKIFEERSVHLKGEGLYNYLNQLNKKLNLNLNFKIEQARCSICNSELKKVKNKDFIKDLVLEETFKHYNEFYQCLNPHCKKIYWEGSHVLDIKSRLDQRL